MSESLDYTVYPDDTPNIITGDISPTADCDHTAAMVVSEDEAEMLNWKAMTKDVQRFVRETDFSETVLIAVRTKSSGPIEYEIDEVTRKSETTIRIFTTAKGVPGPSTPDVETRLVRVHVGDSTPSRAIVVRRTNDPDGNTFEFATDDTTCPKT